MSLTAAAIKKNLERAIATLAHVEKMPMDSNAERFYVASRLRLVRAEISAQIKALEIEAPAELPLQKPEEKKA